MNPEHGRSTAHHSNRRRICAMLILAAAITAGCSPPPPVTPAPPVSELQSVTGSHPMGDAKAPAKSP
jgi:hypothetical protein